MSMAIDTSRNLQVIRNATYGTLGDNTAPRLKIKLKCLLEPDPANDVKAQRRLEPRDDDQFKVPTVPVEWMTWLQHRRKEAPTTEEREQNYVKMIITQQRAKELEDKRRAEDPEPDKEVDISQLNKKMSFPRYADYDEIVKKVEEGTHCPSDDTDSKK